MRRTFCSLIPLIRAHDIGSIGSLPVVLWPHIAVLKIQPSPLLLLRGGNNFPVLLHIDNGPAFLVRFIETLVRSASV